MNTKHYIFIGVIMDQNDTNKKMRSAAIYVTLFLFAAILGITLAFKLDRVAAVFSYIWDALLPVTVGFIIAYLLFPAVRFFETKLFSSMREKGRTGQARAISVILAFSLLLIFVLLIGVLLIPQLFSNYSELATNVGEYIRFAEDFANDFIGNSDLFGDKSTLSELLGGVGLKDFLAGVIVDSLLFADRFVSFIVSVAGGVIDVAMNTVFAVICAFGIMFYREKLIALCSRIANAFLKENQVSFLKAAIGAFDRAFGGFFSGRIFESFLIGLISLAVFYITGMPYPPLLAVILAVFNLIPYFGSIFAGVVGGVIVFVAEPSAVIWFLVIDLVMEQIDGNILAPRVLGDSLGMHPLCIIVSITVMGSILGVLGLIIGVPVAAVLIDAVRYMCEKKEKKASDISDAKEAHDDVDKTPDTELGEGESA